MTDNTSPENFVDYLLEQGRSSAAAIHEFRLIYDNQDTVYLFVEGEADVPYYLPEVRSRARSYEVSPHMCGGKKGVLEVKEFIEKSTYKNAFCLYFVDRDYDDLFASQPVADKNLYITDSYSIENDLVTRKSAEIVLVDLALMSKTDNNYSSIIDGLESAQRLFRKQLLPMLAWGIALRKKGHRPNFNNVDLGKLFKVSPDGLPTKKPNSFVMLKKLASQPGYLVSKAEMKNALATLRGLPFTLAIRGKFDLWFFETYLSSRISSAMNSGSCGAKVKMPASLKERTLFEPLGGRVPKPKSLLNFLDSAFA